MTVRLLAFLVLLPVLDSQDLPRADEVVVLFPTADYQVPDGERRWCMNPPEPP